MRTLLLAVGMVCLASVPLAAQENNTKVEVFGGYQFFHSGNFDGAHDSVNANGFDISATVNFEKRLASPPTSAMPRRVQGIGSTPRFESTPIPSVQRHR